MELEINKVYNVDCLELMREMIRGGGSIRLVDSRPTLWDKRR
jgi:hypothetical protein